MTKPIDPYSRVYWRVLNDERFDGVRADVRHFGSWTLMLLVADMAYPAPAFVPSTVPKASLVKLTECGLIEPLPGGLFRLHGLAAERERRTPSGAGPEPNGTPRGADAVPRRSLARGDETRLDEQRLEETSNTPAPAFGLDLDETAVFMAIAKAGATIRPESGMGQRVLGLIERQGTETVTLELARISTAAGRKLSDRQIVFGLEAALETLPPAVDHRNAILEEEDRKRSEKIAAQVHARRMESWRNGVWHEEWGPQPT